VLQASRVPFTLKTKFGNDRPRLVPLDHSNEGTFTSEVTGPRYTQTALFAMTAIPHHIQPPIRHPSSPLVAYLSPLFSVTRCLSFTSLLHHSSLIPHLLSTTHHLLLTSLLWCSSPVTRLSSTLLVACCLPSLLASLCSPLMNIFLSLLIMK
jgi:hypothetical protein